jgi:hypothetical protein
MTRGEVTAGIKTILTIVSSAKEEDIKLSDALKNYVLPIAGLSLALEVDKMFEKVDLTDLANSLYDSVNTVEELIDYVLHAYDE